MLPYHPKSRYGQSAINSLNEGYIQEGARFLKPVVGESFNLLDCSLEEVYYEKICQDNIRGNPGSGYDPASKVPGAMHLLPHLLGYTPELYPRVAGSITGKAVRL